MQKRPEPETFEVLSAQQLTPNMRRVSIGGDAIRSFPQGQDGGYVKLMIPGTNAADRPSVRTFTIRRQQADGLDIDFALHGGANAGGPGMAWARRAAPGDEIRVGGPGPAKPLRPGADSYLVLGDMTALPAISVNLGELADDATGYALIEIQTEADKQDIKHPEGIEIHWIVNSDPGERPELFEQAVRSVGWVEGRIYAWSATEFNVMKRMRRYLREERGLGSEQLYISSYWKHGLVEDQHREVKSADSEQHATSTA